MRIGVELFDKDDNFLGSTPGSISYEDDKVIVQWTDNFPDLKTSYYRLFPATIPKEGWNED